MISGTTLVDSALGAAHRMSVVGFHNKPAPVQRVVRKVFAFEYVVTGFAVGGFF
ncbi:hypothetical protein SH449x_002997 [Pirellulaceae bacterium SH449]